MQTFLDWPVLTAKTCFDAIRNMGIKRLPKRCEVDEPLDAFLNHATDQERREYAAFCPKTVVARHQNPVTGESFNGFRVINQPYVLVFAMIDNMVLVTAEWKHGNDRITIVPVAGVAGRDEKRLSSLKERMAAVAVREFHEETGIRPAAVIPLSSQEGLFGEPRKMQSQYFPFLARIDKPVKRGPSKLDKNESLKIVVFSLPEWMKLIDSFRLWEENPDFGLESVTRDITYTALSQLGRLSWQLEPRK